MRTKIFTFILSFTVFGLAQAQLEVLKIPAGNEPEIDGMADDLVWNDTSWILMEQNVTGGITTDMTTQFQMLHNDEIIYFIQQVVDATPHNETTITNLYQRDCIEILFHMSDDNSATAYSASTSHFRFQRDGDGEAGLNDGSGKSQAILDALIADDRFEWMVTADDEGYIFEAAFPIEILDGAVTFNGTDFFFDVKATDNTDGTGADNTAGRTQQTYWATADDGKWDNASLIAGVVTLSDTEIEVGGGTSIAKVNAGTSSVSVVNNMLKFRNVEGKVGIYSITGSLVKSGVVEGNGSIEISSLNSGIYFVKTETMTVKFIK